MNKLVTSVFAFLAVLGACTPEKKDQEHDHAAEQAATTKYTCPMHPNVIQDGPGKCPVCGMDLVPMKSQEGESGDLMLTDSQLKLANVTTQKVAVRPIGQTLMLNARIVIDQQKSNVISSRVTGRIERLYHKESGRLIKKGEPLYDIYSELLLTLQQEYLLALQQYAELGKTEARYADFLKASENKLILYGLSRKQVEQLATSKTMQRSVTFVAPAGGIVSEVAAIEGQYVNEGDALYRIEDIETLWIEAEVYPSESKFVKPGDKIAVRVTGSESEETTVTVNFLSPEYQANSQIIVMRATLANPGLRFRPGMQAQVFLTHSSRTALAIPTDAIIRNGKGSHVYVQSAQNTFQPRMVTTGLEDFEQVEIISGLQEDEIVAVSGAYLLYSELILKKGTDPMAGHIH